MTSPMLETDDPGLGRLRTGWTGCGCRWSEVAPGLWSLNEPCYEHRRGWLGRDESAERTRLVLAIYPKEWGIAINGSNMSRAHGG